ncbi:MAG TPA: DUF4190 domain-containing protein [Humisphaera sp.]|jgi:hypothetical protein|nr:DUF4190 domain-containing protein [Humisphaera sp.]
MTQPPINYSMAPRTNGLAIASLVLGIAAFPVSCLPLLHFVCWIAAILAIVLGFIARRQIAAGNGSGAGMALAGMILGIVYLTIAIVMVIAVFAFGVTFLNWARHQAQQQQQQRQGGGPSPSQMFHHALQSAWTLGRMIARR